MLAAAPVLVVSGVASLVGHAGPAVATTAAASTDVPAFELPGVLVGLDLGAIDGAPPELVVFDVDGSEQRRFEIDTEDPYLSLVTATHSHVALVDDADTDEQRDELIIVDVDSGGVTKLPVAGLGDVYVVEGSDKLLVSAASSAQGPAAALIDIERGESVELTRIPGLRRHPIVERPYIEPIRAQMAGSTVVVSEDAEELVHLITVDPTRGPSTATATTLEGILVGVSGDTVIVRRHAGDVTVVDFVAVDGHLRSSSPPLSGAWIIGVLSDRSVAALTERSVVTISEGAAEVTVVAPLDAATDDVRSTAVLADGSLIAISTHESLQLVDSSLPASGALPVGGTMLLQPNIDDNCVLLDGWLVDVGSGDTTAVDGLRPALVSTDGCTIADDRAVAHNGHVVELPNDEFVLGLSPDGRYAVVGPIPSTASPAHVIDLDDAAGPRLQLGSGAWWHFAFLTDEAKDAFRTERATASDWTESPLVPSWIVGAVPPTERPPKESHPRSIPTAPPRRSSTPRSNRPRRQRSCVRGPTPRSRSCPPRPRWP